MGGNVHRTTVECERCHKVWEGKIAHRTTDECFHHQVWKETLYTEKSNASGLGRKVWEGNLLALRECFAKPQIFFAQETFQNGVRNTSI